MKMSFCQESFHPLQEYYENLNEETNFQPAALSYINQWNDYFSSTSSFFINISKLKDSAIQGKLRSCHFRSICWRIFLNCLPHDTNKWKVKIKESRDYYSNVKSRHIFDPHEQLKESCDLELENPLSLSDKSEWSRYFKGNDVKNMIERDVHRTCPELDFFHKEKVQKMLTDILFCYACENPTISYKQGMHELLAPLLFVLHCDLQGFAHASELANLPEIIKTILDPSYLEHDAYFMFNQLMMATNGWYSVRSSDEEQPVADESSRNLSDSSSASPLIITKKLTFIRHVLLASFDEEVYKHLENMQIIPQVYGLRWIRLLFGREFVLQDLLVLWDAIFADSSDLELVDYIFVAMLHHIRNKLLNQDYCQSMQVLMRYPQSIDVYDLINLAFHYKDPKSFPSLQLPKLQEDPVNDQKKKTSNRFLPSLKIENPFSSLSREVFKSMSSMNRTQHGAKSSLSSHKTEKSPTDVSTISSKLNAMKNLSNMFDSSNREGVITNDVLRRSQKDSERKSLFCAQQIDQCIDLIQCNLVTKTQNHAKSPEVLPDDGSGDTSNGEIYLALASLKQVSHILRGNLNVNEYVKSQNIPSSPSLDNLTDCDSPEFDLKPFKDQLSPVQLSNSESVLRKNTF